MADYFLAVITALSIGGILGAYIQARLQRRSEVERQEHALKEKRYLCILMLMVTKLNPSIGLPKIRAIRPDLTSPQDIDNELATELLNGVIFADNAVLEAFASFLRRPDHRTFVDTANAMRQDLWGKKSTLNYGFFELIGMFSNLEPTPKPPPRSRQVISPGIDV